MDEIIVTIERIVPEGKGMGTWVNINGKEFKVYVLGAYPGEKVKVLPTKQKKGFIEAKLIEVIKASPYRIEAFESHHTSHSPWQTINYDYQIELKKEILKKCFSSLAQVDFGKVELFESPKKLGYRTKLEFSFDEEPNYIERRKLEAEGKKADRTQVFLAFHDRGSHKKMLRLDGGCSLGNEKMNEYANNVLKWINKVGLWEFDLKSLVIRYSKYEDKVIGLLLVKNEGERVQRAVDSFVMNSQMGETKQSKSEIASPASQVRNDEDDVILSDSRESKNQILRLETLSLAQDDKMNFSIALSDRRSPMPKIDKILFQNGDDFLIEEIAGLKFKYYLDSFFQNNIEGFEHTIEEIKKFVKPGKILELYSGVGTIGMHFVGGGSEVTGVETIESAVRAAAENATINNLPNYKSVHLPAEKINASLLDGIDSLIVDPPRTGLHQKVIKMIREKLPPQIIYLSCNPITQASDYNLIKDLYDIEYIAGMDYYPNTPHLESLMILKLK